MSWTALPRRAIITVVGEDAQKLLQGVITTDLDQLAAGEVRAGALLSPQGKILSDFLVSRTVDGLRLEAPASAADDLARRLTLYRMRAKVNISVEADATVAVSWGGNAAEETGLRDRRFAGALAVFRHYGEACPPPEASLHDWTRLRIAHGIAEGGTDFPLGDAFPHDVNLDQTGGVSFGKGCFIGQEVVSRMQHRGTARRRVLIAKGETDLPEPGTAIMAGGREIGVLGSVAGAQGLAIVRIDRAKAARGAGHAITAGGVAVELSIPPQARFTWPQNAEADDSQ